MALSKKTRHKDPRWRRLTRQSNWNSDQQRSIDRMITVLSRPMVPLLFNS